MKTDETVYVTCRTLPEGWAETRCVWKSRGLAVTQWLGFAPSVDWDDEEEETPSTEGKYVVTHLPTGGTVCKEPLTEEQAIRLAERILPLADWATMTLTDMVRGLTERPVWAVSVGRVVRGFLDETPPAVEQTGTA